MKPFEDNQKMTLVHRGIKIEYTNDLVKDLKEIHDVDAEQEIKSALDSFIDADKCVATKKPEIESN